VKLNPRGGLNSAPPLMLMNDLWLFWLLCGADFSDSPPRTLRVNLLTGIGVQSVGSDNRPEDQMEPLWYSDGILFFLGEAFVSFSLCLNRS